MENQLPTHILNHLLHNEEFCRRVVPYLQKEYFEGTHKTVFDLIVQFVGKHNKLPTSKILELELKKVHASEEILNSAQILITEIKENMKSKFHRKVWIAENSNFAPPYALTHIF